MWSAEEVTSALRERGDIWETAPGLLGLRGDVLTLFRALESALTLLAREEGGTEWRVPAAISLGTLARADYFSSFPHWLSAASHLSNDAAELERIATSTDPASAAARSLEPAAAALSPAVCYHVYEVLADRTIIPPLTVTVQGNCWRHEGNRLKPLERGWAFTMRETVCFGTTEEVESFRGRGMRRALQFAADLGLKAEIAPAVDPFFAPTARGRALLQRIKELKHELLLPVGPGSTVAAASFNHHGTFFGDAFSIRLADGRSTASGCVAFGLERWLLAVLVAHGLEPARWPDIDKILLPRRKV